jgi:hypothetical protein
VKVIGPLPAVGASKVGVRRVPVPARGDRGRGALVSAGSNPYRDVEEMLVERGVEVDHVTVFRWVQPVRSAGHERFTNSCLDISSTSATRLTN